MKIIKPNAIKLVQGAGFHSMLQHIEYCGRTCYKSEDKITEDSCYRFVNMLKEHAHGAMLEHGTVYLIITFDGISQEEFHTDVPKNNENAYKMSVIKNFIYNKYTKYTIHDMKYYITTNYRVIVENGWEDIMQEFQSECTEYHPKRRTFKITCNRGVSHEFVRHRVFSFAQESQRYCNYSKDKYGKEITFIEPIWQRGLQDSTPLMVDWEDCMENVESTYFFLLENGLTPQLARGVLSNDVKTELIMTGFESDWEHFFTLRCAKDAHPEAQEIANIIKEQF